MNIDISTFAALTTVATLLAFVSGILIGRFSMRDEPKGEMLIPDLKVITRTIEPPTIKKTTVHEFTLVNNQTDRETIVRSINEFGLWWDWLEDRTGGTGHLIIKQGLSWEFEKMERTGIFMNHSMKGIKTRTIEIANPDYINDNATTTARPKK